MAGKGAAGKRENRTGRELSPAAAGGVFSEPREVRDRVMGKLN